MGTIMGYLTAFGLAGGAGTKAFIPVFLLGLLHHTDYFNLAPQFEWIARPPVLVVLGVLIVLELWADAHPDISWLSDLTGYVSKWAAGFIAFAAATGQLDDSLVKLGASGVLGGTTAAGVHFVRNKIRKPFREMSATVESVGKVASLGEGGLSALTSLAAVLMPVLSLVILAGAVGGGLMLAYGWSGREKTCANPACGKPIPVKAEVCAHCRAEQP